jgi:hypothetical protein
MKPLSSATVLNGTALLPSQMTSLGIMQMKTKKDSDDEIRASITEEMAKPRITRSARIAEAKLDNSRIPEQPSVTMPGTVNKIIPAPRSSQPEKAQITVKAAGRNHRNLRIENILTDENGDDVKLKKGSHVEVTVTDASEMP